MAIDPSTPVGKIRLMVSDLSDIPFLPDSVYSQALLDNNNNIPQSAKQCSMYILGMLAFKTHRKMGLQLEVWGKEAFDSYKEFLILVTTNPAFLSYSPIPYSASGTTVPPLIQFQNAWKENFPRGTEDQQLNLNALYSPNDGSVTGPFVISSSEGL